MKAPIALVLALTAAPAGAGSLKDCSIDTGSVMRCLERAKELATEQMLERFLEAKRGVEGLGGRRAELGAEALKQTQRAFERYLAEQCHALAPLLADNAAVALACETDLLRDRAKALEALGAGGERI